MKYDIFTLILKVCNESYYREVNRFLSIMLFTEQRKDARKRKKQREKDAERGEGGADADEMAADDELLSQVST